MKVAIFPPSHKHLLLVLVAFFWHFQLFGRVHVLVMLSTKHANMLKMILMYVLVFTRLV
jgi:hypothetical protein